MKRIANWLRSWFVKPGVIIYENGQLDIKNIRFENITVVMYNDHVSLEFIPKRAEDDPQLSTLFDSNHFIFTEIRPENKAHE